jgi:5-hydroxyisourate hydrolase
VSRLTSHVLDTGLGAPARGMSVRLEVLDDAGAWSLLAERATDDDGRVTDLLGGAPFEARTYRVTFETAPYLEKTGQPVFFPRVEVLFRADPAQEHYHVPLLMSPFGYSTYRGS